MMNLQVRKGSSMLLAFCHCGTFKKNRQNLGWAHSLRLEFYTWFNMEKHIIIVFNGEHSPQQSIPWANGIPRHHMSSREPHSARPNSKAAKPRRWSEMPKVPGTTITGQRYDGSSGRKPCWLVIGLLSIDVNCRGWCYLIRRGIIIIEHWNLHSTSFSNEFKGMTEGQRVLIMAHVDPACDSHTHQKLCELISMILNDLRNCDS